jgi:hypothetical protein
MDAATGRLINNIIFEFKVAQLEDDLIFSYRGNFTAIDLLGNNSFLLDHLIY